MFRKICFELVMTIPGMTSEDEAILGRINNSSVAFVASIFFALHMACQPYDNRPWCGRRVGHEAVQTGASGTDPAGGKGVLLGWEGERSCK
ncbi:unnamed protein product [Durusdinium trenchii]|uniref:Uncharacterized protein n=1 Tax=Durusdinium trenchii TaxID=1381693 RepID=A0ABP0SCK0_9DINO